MKFKLLLLKRVIEDAVMFPLFLLGNFVAILKPLNRQYRTFFFFSFYHTGGAEKVHALIAKATADEHCIIFFTKKSHDKNLLQKFKESGAKLRDISRYTDNKWLYFINIIFRGIIARYINQQAISPVVFNGQCNFAYKLSPWIKKGIRQIELIHSVSDFSYIRIPFLPFITRTVMISQEKIKEHIDLSRRFSIPASYDIRIQYIPNASEFEQISVDEKITKEFIVFYSGRSTPEKRPNLVAEIARKVHEQYPEIKFVMAGSDFSELKTPLNSFIDFKGNVSDESKLQSLYRQSSVLLITSSTEGFPLAVIEGMAYGNVIIATAVGDIPHHIKNGENGFVISDLKNEKHVVAEGATHIIDLYKNQELVKSISRNNIEYAGENFSFKRFGEAYKKMINP